MFYQVQPIDEELASRGDPPTYAEAQTEAFSSLTSKETLVSSPEAGVTDVESGGEWDRVKPVDMHAESVASDGPVGRTSMSSNRRSSVAMDDLESMSRGRTEPPTPADESKTSFLSAGATEDPIIIVNSVESQGPTPPEPGSPAKEQKEMMLPRKKSKKGKKDHHRSKSRDPLGEASEKKQKDKGRPDRECSVM